MSSTVTVNGGNQTLPGPGRDSSWGAYTTNLLTALAANSGRDLSKAIFFDKNGSDSNDGLTPAKSVLTIGQAVTLANALSPSVSNPIAIVGLDAGIYTETTNTLAQYVHLVAPSASVVGSIVMLPESSCVLYSLTTDTDGYGINASGAGNVYFDVRCLVHSGTAGGAIRVGGVSATVLNGMAGVVSADIKYEVAATDTLNLLCHSISGTAVGSGTANVIAANTVFSGLGFLKADGTVAMSGNLNMDSNDIDSVADIACNTITINGVQFSADANGLYEV